MSLIPYCILSLHHAPRAMPLPKANTTSVYIIGAARPSSFPKYLSVCPQGLWPVLSFPSEQLRKQQETRLTTNAGIPDIHK